LTDYLNEPSDFYNKCRQRAQNLGEPPLKFTDELSKKAERLESFSRHIDEEKQKVKGRFEEIKRYTLEMIDLKEKECIRLLEDEVSELSDLYMQWEELLVKEWPKSSDIEARYPTSDVLEQRMSRFVNLDQLQAFVKGVTDDIQSESQFGNEVDGLKRKVNSLISCARKVESSLPSLQGKLLESSSEDLQSLMKELLKGFDQQEIKIENSLVLKMKELACCESQIINFQQYETLKNWLPNSNNLSLKLLYRGSEDGLSAEMFHEKCDGKGATITLIQSRFKGDASSRVLGGFADQSWHSRGAYTSSERAFLFSMASGVSPIKCSIERVDRAIYGSSINGPCFGGGEICDLQIEEDFSTGNMCPNSYPLSGRLHHNDQDTFAVEDVEVFQVL